MSCTWQFGASAPLRVAPPPASRRNAYARITRGQPTSSLNHHIRYLLLSMDHLASTTSRRQYKRRRIGQGAISDNSQRRRYASFSCYAYRLLSEHGPWATVDGLYRSTSSTTIPFCMCFITVSHFGGTNMASRIGFTMDGGGMRYPMPAEDGETSFLARPPIWVFPCSAHMARPSQTCSQVHLPFHSSSATSGKIVCSPQKKKE